MGRLSSISRPGAAPFAAASDVGTAALVSRYRLASGVRRDPAFARRLPAGLMPWQRAGPGTTDPLTRCINRASTGKGVAQPCRTISLRAPATVALRENVWRSRIPFRPENVGPCCCRWRKSGSGWRTSSTWTAARPCCGRSRASSRPCSSNSRFSPRTTTSKNKPPQMTAGPRPGTEWR